MTNKPRIIRKIARNAFWGPFFSRSARLSLFLAAAGLLLPTTSFAQSPVNVTATVKDSAGIPYSNATVSILLIPTGTAPTVGGAQISGTNNGQLDVNGKLNVSLYKNTDIVPANSKWQFTICETPGVAPPLGTGGQCFNSSQTISAAVDLSTQFQAVAPALTTITFVAGSVTHTAGNLTAGNVVIGNGAADVKVDSACATNGTGALSGCTSINTPGTVTGNIGSFNSVGTNLMDVACAAQSVSSASQDRFYCDGTNWPVVSMNTNAAQKLALSMGVNAQTVSYLAVQSDCGKLITMNGVSLTFTLPAAIINSACVFDVKNLAATSLTIARNGLNVDGAASNPTALTQNQSYRITNDGAGYWTEALMISAAAPVSSVFTRTGAVVAAANDYTLNQIGNPVAAVSFQPTVDAGFLFKQSNTTNTVDIFGIKNKTGTDLFRIDNNGTFRAENDNFSISSTGGVSSPNYNLPGAGTITVGGVVLISQTAPTISSGFGTGASVSANNGTASFRINVGTGGVATTGVIGLPAATTGWNCEITDLTTQTATVDVTRQTGVGTTTTVPIGNFTSGGIAGAWVASDILGVSCHAL